MKFLCLPGAYGSAKNFQVQLGPISSELERRGLATFVFTQGKHRVEPPPGFENYFGTTACYRFIDTRHGDVFEHLRRIVQFPHGESAEWDMRELLKMGTSSEEKHPEVMMEAIDDVNKELDEHPDVDAIIGYSEGALVAASLVLDEAIQAQKTGRARRIKLAVFIAGSPPFKQEADDMVSCQLADEVGAVIDIPTFHIWGVGDPFLSCAVALFNVCDPKKAELFDHGQGHIVPRDAAMVNEVCDELAHTISIAEDEDFFYGAR